MNFVPFAFSPVTNESICFLVVSLVDCVITLLLFVSFRVDKMISYDIFFSSFLLLCNLQLFKG